MKGKFTSVILAVVLVVITVGTVFFGYSKASGKAAKSSVEGLWQPVVQKILLHIFLQHSLQKK